MVNCELRIAFPLLTTADCLLLTGHCLLNLREVRVGGILASYRTVYDKMSRPRWKERTSNFKK
jgi:hypothetical protein